MSEGSNTPAWGAELTPDANPRRRKFLLGTTIGLGAIGTSAAAYPFLRSWVPSAKANAVGGPVTVDISALKENQIMLVEWRSKPVFVIRQSADAINSLSKGLSRLADPDSESAVQPEYIANLSRSVREDITILVGLCTHLGCAPKFVPEQIPQDFDSEWLGGFFCPCHGSKFDLAGRVYKSVPAPINMEVPPHRFAEENTLIIGEDESKA